MDKEDDFIIYIQISDQDTMDYEDDFIIYRINLLEIRLLGICTHYCSFSSITLNHHSCQNISSIPKHKK